MAAVIRLVELNDAPEISAIYKEFVEDTAVSFETIAPTPEEIRQRISERIDQYPWIVVEVDGTVAGYAYASQHRARFHYQWSVDFTVYIHRDYRKLGLGSQLYAVLKRLSVLVGYVSAYAGIALPNEASVNLHKRIGFSEVGVYKNVGFKLGRWHDVSWWHCQLIDPPALPPQIIPLIELVDTAVWQAAFNIAAENA